MLPVKLRKLPSFPSEDEFEIYISFSFKDADILLDSYVVPFQGLRGAALSTPSKENTPISRSRRGGAGCAFTPARALLRASVHAAQPAEAPALPFSPCSLSGTGIDLDSEVSPVAGMAWGLLIKDRNVNCAPGLSPGKLTGPHPPGRAPSTAAWSLRPAGGAVQGAWRRVSGSCQSDFRSRTERSSRIEELGHWAGEKPERRGHMRKRDMNTREEGE